MSDLQPYPAHVRGNPIMAQAFADFCAWAWDRADFHEQFTRDTGTPPLPKQESALDAMIDEATGLAQSYAEKFLPWLIEKHWGAEGIDDQDETQELEK